MSPKAIDHVIESQVLVIGSGLAGSLAAIKSHQSGNQVVVANKGPIVGGGATSIIGGKTMSVFFPTDDKDFWMRKFLEVGKHEVDREWLKIHLDETYDHVLELDQLGGKYKEPIFPRDPRDKTGGLWRLGPWEIEDYKAVVFNGPAAEAAFRKKILADKIPFYPRVEMTSLIKDGRQVVGAVGFNYRNGETYLFKARAIILACGGVRFDDKISSTAGEGILMAYDAGALLRSLGKEKARFKPKYFSHLGALGDGFYSDGTSYPFNGKLINRLGEAFMEKAPPGRDLEEAIRKEISGGRGPIYEDWTQIPRELHEIVISLKKPHWKLTRAKYGLDSLKDRIPFPEPHEQVALPGRTCHFGVKIDSKCASNIPGLFATGDTACNFIRKSPFRGDALAWALLTGSRVSQFAKEYVASSPEPAIREREILAQAKDSVASLTIPLMRNQGLSPDEVASGLLISLSSFDRICSSRELMKKALAEVLKLREEKVNQLKARDHHELKKAFEVKSLLLNVEIILKSQLFREENDIPQKDFPMHTMIEKREGNMHVYGKAIPLPLYAAPYSQR